MLPFAVLSFLTTFLTFPDLFAGFGALVSFAGFDFFADLVEVVLATFFGLLTPFFGLLAPFFGLSEPFFGLGGCLVLGAAFFFAGWVATSAWAFLFGIVQFDVDRL